jgi:osmotically-inducible protein OsmY
MTIPMRVPGAAAFALAFALALPGCGDGGDADTETALTDAIAETERLAADVEAARAEVEREQSELDSARAQLAEAEKLLAEGEREVSRHASDPYLFRAVQRGLLEDAELDGLAISARVNQRVVTLEGAVPSAALRTRAEEIAAGTPGVLDTQNRISIDVAAAPED